MEPRRLEEIKKIAKATEDRNVRHAMRDCLEEIELLKAELTVARCGLDLMLRKVG